MRQDDVYVKTCELQAINAVFGADLFYNDNCMLCYMRAYEKRNQEKQYSTSLKNNKYGWIL